MTRTLKNRISIGLIALLVVGGLVYAFLPRPVGVDLAPVQRGPLRVTVDHEGKTRIKERYTVAAPLPGQLRRIHLEANDPVEQGATLLAVIEPPEPALLDARTLAEAEARLKGAEAGQRQAGAQLAKDRAAYEYAQTELTRARTLKQHATISAQEWDEAQRREKIAAEEFHRAQFAVQVAAFEVKIARAALINIGSIGSTSIPAAPFKIYSPIDGRVLKVFQKSATAIATGAPLLELGNPTNLEVEIDVLSQDAVKIHPGATVFFEHWGGPRPLRGHVRYIEPAAFTKISALGVEEQRVWVIADFDEPAGSLKALGDGYRVEAQIVVWQGKNVLKVPAGALFRVDGDWAVYVCEDGRARLHKLRIGHDNGLEAEVQSGLREGENVILYPSDRIRDGVRVFSRRSKY